jgi:MFS family permease
MFTSLHLPATFRAFQHRNYRLWFFGQGVSLIGTWMQTMAQQVLVYRLTGSAASLGIISFIGLVPVIPLSLWGGSITDRFPRRTIMLITQAIMLVQALLLAVLAWSGAVQIWHIYVLAFILGAATAVDLPARQAFTVDMVEGKEDLPSAIGMNSAMFNGARAIGPALAGILVATTGEGNAFFLNGLTFVAVIISLLMMRGLPKPKSQIERESSPFKHMAGGLNFIFQHRVILILISLIAISAFLSMPYNTLLPVFASVVLKQSAQPVVATLCNSNSLFMCCQAPEALPLGLLYSMI